MLKYRHQAINTSCEAVIEESEQLATIPKELRSAAIVAAYVDDFLTAQGDLPRIIQAIENLRAGDLPRATQGPRKGRPWWKLW